MALKNDFVFFFFKCSWYRICCDIQRALTNVLGLFTSWAGEFTSEATPPCSVLFDQVDRSPVWTSELETVEPLKIIAGFFHPIYLIVKSCPI